MNEYYNQQTTSPTPRVTWWVQRLILLNISIYVLQVISLPLITLVVAVTNLAEYPIVKYLIIPVLPFNPELFLHGFIWTPVTYQFLHGGLMHLFGNMLGLYFCGPEVERTLGSRQFLRFYLFCGTLGVLMSFLPYFIRGDNPTVIGASGAVMGVIVAFAMMKPNEKFFIIPIPFPISAKGLVVIALIYNFSLSFRNTDIAWSVHLGGMGCGYLYMKMLPRWNRLRREKRAQQNAAKNEKVDNVAEAVDNIFRFEDRKRK